MALYNSALKNSTSRLSDLKPLQRWEHENGVALAHNLTKAPLPSEFNACDVFYCEPPFPAGLKVFDKRAGAHTDGMLEFGTAFAAMWAGIKKPKLAIVSKTLMRYIEERPTCTVQVKLNDNWETLACWGIRMQGGLRNTQITYELGKRFSHIGDMTCGYGVPVMQFLAARPSNRFTVSDYDPHCIDAFRRIMEGQV